MELAELGRTLQNELVGSRADLDQHRVFLDHPLLFSRLVSKLTYCVRDAPLRYVAVNIPETDEAFQITVYTDDHVFHMSYDPTVDHITTTVVNRSSVRFIELLSAPNFMAGDQPGTYRGGLDVLVTYQDVVVRLPGDNHATDKNREQLDEFWPSLLRDLAQR
jgi:predicted 2-oxoglutarate/Fe(II)-dependent dioxygenase YbiX